MEAGELFALFDVAGDAAFAVDLEGRIHYWSESAERLLGFPASAMLDQDCAQVIEGCDDEGCRICSVRCSVIEQARAGNPVSAYDLHAATAWGERKWLNISVILAEVDDGPSPLIVHLMRDAERRKSEEQFAREIVIRVSELTGSTAGRTRPATIHSKTVVNLSRRELTILQSLARGDSTPTIAKRLFISPTTVRNHIQRILKKLECHSRLEAVMRAAREGLI